MGSTQVGFKVCGSELRRSKDHKGKKVQNLRKSQLLNLRQFQRSWDRQIRPANLFFSRSARTNISVCGSLDVSWQFEISRNVTFTHRYFKTGDLLSLLLLFLKHFNFSRFMFPGQFCCQMITCQ